MTHFEFGSSSSPEETLALVTRNKQTFVEQHHDQYLWTAAFSA